MPQWPWLSEMPRSKDSRRAVSADDDADGVAVQRHLRPGSVNDSRDWERDHLDNTVEANWSVQLPHRGCYQS